MPVLVRRPWVRNWSTSAPPARHEAEWVPWWPRTDQLNVVVYDAPGLGDRSYLVHDGRVGAVIDAQRDPAPYLATAASLGVEIALVLETHVHNDYVSGGLALARRAGADYGIPAGEPVHFAAESDALDEGDARSVGGLALRVLATPGHTPHHLSYLFEDVHGSSAVLTGGSLLGRGHGQDRSPRAGSRR